MKKPPAKKKKASGPKPIGKITHYFGKINVAVVKLSAPLKAGDHILIRTGEGEFTQKVDSMQVNHKTILGARKGSEIGLKISKKAKEGDLVFKAEQPQPEQLPIMPIPKVEYKPILPQRIETRKEPEHRMVPPHIIPQPPPAPPRQQPKPRGYNDVKFLKF
ncbi:hypothetical protein A2276_00820 [candidate division WOR-1 bacterium RIFOXYA12_FULL_43_27]|uniref:Translation elongation factor-like protein n=1 Tax=candidate division WOR-1 bacterium RIFOXYC2_FULL_46_14 TaxID=1802587 RepID=A0A1F4U4U7_UNCSA|nr:MAG: hypothetical protein A2276_00820 [candidate division WOR-1 bacterium RIFOXYA12_FULL_43_27]OGC20771.1 MAG: hypothetical protein A2292_07055 [candidate division WOR-1 bacterium RIFOXYB2_FULL_46_45]OGC31492.1 MAG: hypothetical protein A2232_04395 [candidate division WOR-1 bacterium RIFOXYA2_FULL_46_56]OGC39899.1 MAG: hypothetical protein A2438_05235 [candidate division WOR-1 bacterium RIFOXYC2_FULL_46_14]